jgi:hypothetical protein
MPGSDAPPPLATCALPGALGSSDAFILLLGNQSFFVLLG